MSGDECVALSVAEFYLCMCVVSLLSVCSGALVLNDMCCFVLCYWLSVSFCFAKMGVTGL